MFDPSTIVLAPPLGGRRKRIRRPMLMAAAAAAIGILGYVVVAIVLGAIFQLTGFR